MIVNVLNLEPQKSLKSRPLPVVEVFGNTIQGEGPYLGPAVFVRFGLCNFKCAGFGCTRVAPNGEVITGCDTIHAVSPKFKDTWKHFTGAEDLIDSVKGVIDETSKNFKNPGMKPAIIVTGGEPTMHWDNQVFQDFLKFFADNGYPITMETNASKVVTFSENYQTKIRFSMSVKLSASGEPLHKRVNIEAINKLIKFGNHSYFKFVVNPETWENDQQEVNEILQGSLKAPVYMMPMGETIEKQLKHTRFVFDLCAKEGFMFSPRAHILAYDDLDGV